MKTVSINFKSGDVFIWNDIKAAAAYADMTYDVFRSRLIREGYFLSGGVMYGNAYTQKSARGGLREKSFN